MIWLRHCCVWVVLPGFMLFAGPSWTAGPVSGYDFLTPETQAMQNDDFENPGMVAVEKGAALFRELVPVKNTPVPTAMAVRAGNWIKDSSQATRNSTRIPANW